MKYGENTYKLKFLLSIGGGVAFSSRNADTHVFAVQIIHLYVINLTLGAVKHNFGWFWRLYIPTHGDTELCKVLGELIGSEIERNYKFYLIA